MTSFYEDSIFVFGTAPSTRIMKESLSKHLKDKDIFSWSSSYNFCVEEIGIVPKYWSYLDAYGAVMTSSSSAGMPLVNVLQKMGDNKKYTKTLIFSDIVTKTHHNQEQYIGASRLVTSLVNRPLVERVYSDYVSKLFHFAKEANVDFIPTTTYKDLHGTFRTPKSLPHPPFGTSISYLHKLTDFDSFIGSDGKMLVGDYKKCQNKAIKWLNEIDYGQDKFEERFTQEKLILGTNIKMPSECVGDMQRDLMGFWRGAIPKSVKTPHIPMEHQESKLTMCVLPLCYYLGKKNVFLVGFDGIHDNIIYRDDGNIELINMSYKHHLPKAISSFKKLGMNVYSIVPDELTHLNQYMEYVPIESL
jgi:hypothetical protein